MSAVESVKAPVADADSPCSRAISLPAALATPWLACLASGRAARRMTRASLGAMAAVFVVQTLLLTAIVLVLMLLEGMLTIRPTSPAPATWPASAPRVYRVVRPGIRAEWRPAGEVWREWRRPAGLGVPGTILLIVSVGVPAVAAIGAALHLPSVHRKGSVGVSLRHAAAAILAASGPLLALVAIGGLAIVAAAELIDPIDQGALPLPLPLPGEAMIWLCVLSSLLILVGATGKAAAGAEAPLDEVQLPPRCEGCGYDLSHTRPDDRCPECGLAARHSTDGVLYRQGVEWQRRHDLASWVETSFSALLAPSTFYRALRLRGEDDAARFRRIQLAAVPLFSAVWLTVIALVSGISPSQAPVFTLLLTAVVGLAGWFVGRLAAGLATVPWILGDRLPDFRWARRVMAYESVYLWVFCAFNGMVLSIGMASGNFGKWLFTTRAFFSLPLGQTLLLFGNLGLGFFWIWRYQIALRAVRWSNR